MSPNYCFTDMATKLSQKCCEQLVAAGAINTLLELIRSVSRSIADQEVLRHTLSTFRNITRHPHLTEALIDTRGSGQIILWEFIRSVKTFIDSFYSCIAITCPISSYFVIYSSAETKKTFTSLQLMF